MDTATPRPQSAFKAAMPRKKGPPTALRINTPVHNSNIALDFSDTSASASTLSSATSDSDSFIFPPPTKSRSRNMKKLSLTLPSAQSSSNSLLIPDAPQSPAQLPAASRARRPSVLSLPNASTGTLLHRKDEDGDGSPSAPYLDGPIQILPGIWLGSEDNARDWKTLVERGIKSILNVAKEVVTVFDKNNAQPLRPFQSTPDLSTTNSTSDPTYYPAHVPSGRPAMHYLKLHWSHGQSDLVRSGFPSAMQFVDQALQRADGVLIHCQCGVSRSATLVIALVMRAAAQCSPSVPPEIWALQGMHGAYSYVKEKSKWVSPNMSLIYQLLDYERSFKRGSTSPATSEHSSVTQEEEEWERRRQMLDETDDAEDDNAEIMREARALDKAMEDRLVARKSSTSSISSTGTGRGMGKAWRNRYGHRKRTGSVGSVLTNGSILSEDLVEEDEEQELLGTGGGFTSSTNTTEDEASSLSSADPNSRQPSPHNVGEELPASRMPPPSAPAHKNTFLLPPVPATAVRSTFQFPSRQPQQQPKVKARKRPPPLISLLPPVPSSPVTPIVPATAVPARTRLESRKPETPPARLRSRPTNSRTSSSSSSSYPLSATPSQTLFVFPPSPTRATSIHTPSTMTLTSNASFPFPSSVSTTPRISTFRSQGRCRSWIGVPPVSTPTVASSRVDARGWIGPH